MVKKDAKLKLFPFERDFAPVEINVIGSRRKCCIANKLWPVAEYKNSWRNTSMCFVLGRSIKPLLLGTPYWQCHFLNDLGSSEKK